MNRIILTLLLVTFVLSGLAQRNIVFSRGSVFLKRIENNYKHGRLNMDSKTDIEKLFFGDMNADVEFCVEPSFSEAYGFRVIIDTISNSYTLEVKRISNYKKIDSLLEQKYPGISIPIEQFDSISQNELERTKLHNKQMYEKIRLERPGLYKVETSSLPITWELAYKIHTKFALAIDGYRGVGNPSAAADGENITLRCVAGYDLWTLTVHSPLDGIRGLADICKQLIKDAESGSLDQQKYVDLLGD